GNEVVQYQTFRDGSFQGCSRGVHRDAPLKDNGPPQEHKKGTRVIDYVAYKLATNLVAAHPGSLTSFDTLEALRTIDAWGGAGVVEPERYEALAPFLTVWSRRETVESFLDGQMIVNALPSAGGDGGGELIQVRDRTFVGGSSAYFNPNTIVRVSDGTTTDYLVVMQQGDDKGGQIGFALTTANPLPEGHKYEGRRARVESLAPYPIDLNGAPREILAAVFSGLRRRDSDGKDAKSSVS